MSNVYRLEFNEKQQQLHLDNYTHEEQTHGWITVYKCCTDLEFWVFRSFLEANITGRKTNQNVLECASKYEAFMKNLVQNRLQITRA